jgi:uncharacterized protein
MPILAATLFLILAGNAPLVAQGRYSGPIVDVHVHTADLARRVQEMNDHGIVKAVVSGRYGELRSWTESEPDRTIASLLLPCRRASEAVACYPEGAEDSTVLPDTLDILPDLGWVRAELDAGRILALGELNGQYSGLSPTDERLAPYFALAAEYDVPVGIHLSLAHPTVPGRLPAFRAYLGKPLLLEDVLARHRDLRVYVMHAGFPYLEEMLALLGMYPNVYVDMSGIAVSLPPAVFHAYLERFVEVGLHDRVMFGSDYVGAISTTIAAIDSAPFLTSSQKRDVFCSNAVRFFRLSEVTCD